MRTGLFYGGAGAHRGPQRGIPFFNSPYANTRSVAELALGEMVMLARQTLDRSMELHRGTWNKKSAGCYELRGKTLGIVGYGHVGSQLSVIAESMGMRVLFYDVVKKLSLGNAEQVDTMEGLLRSSDFVSLHVPKSESTNMLIGAEQIAVMPRGAYLINLARGTVVDIEAAAEALKSGHLAGGAFDVYPVEPPGPTDSFKMALQGCPNTILTPHIGGSTEEAQEAIGSEVSGKMINFLNMGSTSNAVNVPVIDVHERLSPGFVRIVSFHKNVPGVIRDINAVLASGNVTYQALRTSSSIGYLVCDIDGTVIEEARSGLVGLNNSIRTYVLQRGAGYQGTPLGDAEGCDEPRGSLLRVPSPTASRAAPPGV